ncbi:ammonium transporter Rh type B isoform X1 [Neocloeon triangulifer]|uniref:ammonium transporter Rh type B isoform X1 n=1 Tax=Neocloeon triangulifer TaxID=2078957 RepID=UPI00286F8875|nr:ammonium transporter Rh type B isoform X1 [Neocloeon triangulifer]
MPERCGCCTSSPVGPGAAVARRRKVSRLGDARGRQLQRMRDGLVVALLQAALLTLTMLATQYEPHADASDSRNSYLPVMGGFDQRNLRISKHYIMFQDVHVMVFVGVGFLMTFLRKYGYSAVGFNFLVSALSLQWAILARGFFEMDNGRINVGITSMLGADFATVAVIISLGAVIGKTTPLQLIVMALIEIALFATNEWFGINVLKAVDAGGSMYVHVFGAYFGLAVSLALRRKDNPDFSNESAEYHSDLFAMIGTLFLWVFWPSFNAALVTGDNQYRAVINTYFSLAACCVTAFAVSSLVAKDNKFNMVHIQNSTLAGGVAVGTAADMMLYPYGALAVGIAAGTLSVLGYTYIQPALLRTIKLHDTCGVHNLHGMPGVLAGLIGALMAALASEKEYGESLYLQFPARAPMNNTSALNDVNEVLMFLEPGDNRSAIRQAGFQLIALLVTFIVAIVGGLITGFLLSCEWMGQVPRDRFFDDAHFWEVPTDEEHSAGTPPITPEAHANPVFSRKESQDSKC